MPTVHFLLVVISLSMQLALEGNFTLNATGRLLLFRTFLASGVQAIVLEKQMEKADNVLDTALEFEREK